VTPFVSSSRYSELLLQADIKEDYERAETLYKQALKVRVYGIGDLCKSYLMSSVADRANSCKYAVQLRRAYGLPQKA
jgi:hypothetical protein